MYTLRFFFEWGATHCLWCGDDETTARYGVGPIQFDDLPLSDSLKATLLQMGEEYQTALNWQYPPDPSPWTAEHRADFLRRSEDVYRQLVEELGAEHHVLYQVTCPE
ncbi:MAG: hypothetical protein J6R77_03180 [Clostridia bacterium]|nr:hypothetical protein [Clostridia bacterium]